MRTKEKSHAKILTFLILLTIAVAFFLTGNLVRTQTNKMMKDEIESRITLQSQTLAEQMNAFFKQKGLMLEQLRANQAIIRYVKTTRSRDEAFSNPNYNEAEVALEAVQKLDKNVGMVWLASEEGNFLIGDGHRLANQDWSLHTRPWYEGARLTTDVFFSESYVDHLTGEIVTSGTLPIVDGGKILGFVGIDLLLDDIPGIMNAYPIGKTGYPILLSRNGTIMYHPKPELVNKLKLPELTGSLKEIGENMIAGKSGLQLLTINGVNKYIGYASIPYSGWSVAAVLPAGEAFELLDSVQGLSTIIIISSVCILVSLLYLLLHFMLKEQKRIQAELVHAIDEAEEANKTKTLFLARMSHEIRTPLNGILGLSQLMQKTKLTEMQQDYLGKILSSSQVLLRLINEVLDFSKIEAGKLEIEKVSFDPEEVIRRLSSMLSIYTGTKQIEVIIETPSSLPVALIGDQHRLEQILLNLCSNAIKFTERGYVSLRLSIVHEDNASIIMLFTVQDTGIGMSTEQMERLFEPFTQADGTTSRKYGGTGLGLVISQELIEMMGGILKVSSEIDCGSIFSFTLRFEKPLNRDSVRLALPEECEGLPVLVIEDHERMRHNLTQMLTSFSLVPTPVSTWQRAFAQIEQPGKRSLFRFILLDMEAEDMYGVESLKRLFASIDRSQTITVALTTPYGRDELARLDECDQPDAVLIKPVSRMELLRVLQAAMKQNEPLPPQLSAPAPKTDLSLEGYRGRILLAEDHEINQIVAVEMLRRLGFSVTVAKNGRDVLKMLDESKCDLILMDVHMPEMDGCEATLLIRQDNRYSDLPIIAMTASVIKEEHDYCYTVGMNGVITKPIDQSEMAAFLGKMVPLPLLDVNQSLERLDGKQQIYASILSLFAQEYADFFDRLQEKLRSGDQLTAKRMVHTLSGVAGNLSAQRLLLASKKVEELLTLSLPFKEYEESMRKLEQHLHDVLMLVQDWQNNQE